MQLPKELQKFPNPTLLIASDSVSAKFFLLGGDAMQELDGVSLPRENKQDSEGEFMSYDGSRAGGPAEIRDEPRLHAFIHALVEKTSELVRSHAIAHIYLIMPAEVERPFSGHLSDDVSAKIAKRIHKDLMKESPIDLVERILRA